MVSPRPLAGAWLATGAALFAAGCAVFGPVAGPASVPAAATPWQTLTGGWLATAAPPGAAVPVPRLQRVTLVHPCGVAVHRSLVFIADCATGELLRYDRARDTITISAAISDPAPGPSVAMIVADDLGMYVANPAEGIVTRHDGDGKLVRLYRDPATPGQPVAVAVDERRGEVFVADADQRRVVVFGPGGELRRVLGGEGRVALQSIAAMALGPDGIYVLDRQAQQVVVLGPAGELRRTFSDDSLIAPGLMAVDHAGRVFIVDEADQTVSMFVHGENVSRMGGRGAEPGRFGTITALAVDGNLLYVADGARANVQILLLTPESMRRRGDR